jgi:pyruvate dehydrogenase E1 component alpha subunit
MEKSISKTETAKELYEKLLTVRRVDEIMCRLQKIGELIIWPSLKGQEAINVAAIAALSKMYLFLSYREHGLAFYRAGDFSKYIGLFKGVSFGNDYWDDSMLSPCNLLIGDQLIHAVGYSYAEQYKKVREKQDNLREIGVFFGDGAMSQGASNEAFLFAASLEIPILFICVNNQYAISTFHTKQSKMPFYKRLRGYGIESESVDGNELWTLIDAFEKARQYIKDQQKPYFLECVTYRVNGHTTVDNHLLYRSKEEIEKWEKHDPILLYEEYLDKNGISSFSLREEANKQLKETELVLERQVKGIKEKNSRDDLQNLTLYGEEVKQRDRFLNFLKRNEK